MRNPRPAVLAVALMLPALPVPAHAEPLTVTELLPAQSDPMNAAAEMVGDLWRDELGQIKAAGRAYSLLYATFEAEGGRFMVSAIAGPDCVKDACAWRVVRLTPDDRISAVSEPVEACGEQDRLDLTAGKLTICDRVVSLP